MRQGEETHVAAVFGEASLHAGHDETDSDDAENRPENTEDDFRRARRIFRRALRLLRVFLAAERIRRVLRRRFRGNAPARRRGEDEMQHADRQNREAEKKRDYAETERSRENEEQHVALRAFRSEKTDEIFP